LFTDDYNDRLSEVRRAMICYILLVSGFVLHMNYLFIIRLVNVKNNDAMTLDCKKNLDIK